MRVSGVLTGDEDENRGSRYFVQHDTTDVLPQSNKQTFLLKLRHNPASVQTTITRITLSAALVLVAASCDAHIATLTPYPLVDIVRVAEEINQDDDVILKVDAESPSTIEVVYWNDPGKKLMYRTPERVSNASVALGRLRPGRVYQYEVSALNSSGSRGRAQHGEVVAPQVSAELQALEFSAIGSSGAPVVMLEVSAAFKGFVAVNAAGEPVWHCRTRGGPQGFTRRRNGNFVFIDAGYGLFEVSPAGKVVHELLPLPNGDRAAHHDVIATPANTLLFIAQETRPVGESTLTGEAIWEWNPETGPG